MLEPNIQENEGSWGFLQRRLVGVALAVRQRLRRCQRQQGRKGVCGSVCGFAGNSGGGGGRFVAWRYAERCGLDGLV